MTTDFSAIIQSNTSPVRRVEQAQVLLARLQSLFSGAYEDMISISKGFQGLSEKADEISQIWALSNGGYLTTKVMEKIFCITNHQLRHAIGDSEEDALSLKDLVLAIDTVTFQV